MAEHPAPQEGAKSDANLTQPSKYIARWEPAPRSAWEKMLWRGWRHLPYQERMRRKGGSRGQKTWCWCPFCGSDLVSNPTTTYADAERVTYRCGWCDATSIWDFDAAPTPVLVWP